MNNKSNLRYILLFVMLIVMIMPVMSVMDISAATYPDDNEYINDNQPDFTFVATSTIEDPFSCSLFINGILNKTDGAVANNTPAVIEPDDALDDGTYVWYINCTDADNSDIEGPYTINIDTEAPTTTDDADGAWHGDNQSITLTPIDTFSGMVGGSADTKYCNYTGEIECTPEISGTTMEINCAEGSVCQRKIRYYSTDYTGNDEGAHDGANEVWIDRQAPTYTWNTPDNDSVYTNGDIISIDVDVSDGSGAGISDSALCNVMINGDTAGFSGALNYAIGTDKCAGDITLDDPTSLSEGPNYITVSVADDVGNVEVSPSIQVILDNSAPQILDATQYMGPLGYGIIYAADEFFSTSPGNNVVNLSINFSDAYSSIADVTFDMTELCGGITVIKNSAGANGFWWANCTVDQEADFELKNITITACDEIGNCDTTFRSVMVYNFTTPPGMEGAYEFGADTTDLSEQTNLADVNYVIDLRVNGSLLPGTPWADFRKAALLDFASLNMTSSDISSKLYNLINAIDISIAAPGEFGANRIFVDTDAFAELNSDAEITLYNLPFKWTDESEATVLNETGGTGGIILIDWEGDGITGNLTFSVEGFSGYNVSDSDEPVVEITAPDDEDGIIGGSITINVTANGTGSEISNVVISFGGVDYSWEDLDFNCSAIEENSEVFTCSFLAEIYSGEYEITATAYDYGGASPGNDGTDTISITVNDTEAPEISGASPSGSISYRTSATLSVTTDDNATCRYSNQDINFANMTAMTDAATTHTQVVTVAASTSYTFYVRCKDWANNTNNVSTTISFSVGRRTSGGGGGGGGGSGSIVTYNPSTSQTWTRINPGGTQIMKVVSNEFGVKEISISVINPANNVKILVEKLSGKPASVTKNVTGKVFQYLKIDKTNLNDSDLNGTARIKFQVNQSWLKSNSLEARNIILKRFADNNWQDLKTTLLSTDGIYAYYEAETPGFSYFAIAEGAVVVPTAPVPDMPEAGEAEAGGEETSGEQPSGQEPPSTTPGTGEVKEEQSGDSGKVKPSASNVLKTVLTMLVILLVIGLIVVWVSRGGKLPKMPKIFHKRSKFKTLEGEE